MDTIAYVEELLQKIQSCQKERQSNKEKLRLLFEEFGLKNVESFEALFEFNAINLTGVSLQPENLASLKPKRYIQIIGIKRAKNYNLKYFGNTLTKEQVYKICEFVLRWRLEKGFMTTQYYKDLLQKLKHDSQQME